MSQGYVEISRRSQGIRIDPGGVELPRGGDKKSRSRRNSKKRPRNEDEGEGDGPPQEGAGQGGEGNQGGNGANDDNNEGGGNAPDGDGSDDDPEESEEDDSSNSESTESSSSETSSDSGVGLNSRKFPLRKRKRKHHRSKHRHKDRRREKAFKARLCGQNKGYLSVLEFLSGLGITPSHRPSCQESYPLHKKGPKIAGFPRRPTVNDNIQSVGRIFSFGEVCPAPTPSLLSKDALPEDILKYLNVVMKAEKSDFANVEMVASYKSSSISKDALRRASQRSFPSFFPKIRSHGIRDNVPEDGALAIFSRNLEASINRLFGIISAVWMGDSQLTVTLATDILAMQLNEWKKVLLLRSTEGEKKALTDLDEIVDPPSDNKNIREDPVVIVHVPSSQPMIPLKVPDTPPQTPPIATNIPPTPPPPSLNATQTLPVSVIAPIIAEWANAHSPRASPRNASPNQFFRNDQPGRGPHPRRRFSKSPRFERGARGSK
jgi:hypothetical protein